MAEPSARRVERSRLRRWPERAQSNIAGLRAEHDRLPTMRPIALAVGHVNCCGLPAHGTRFGGKAAGHAPFRCLIGNGRRPGPACPPVRPAKSTGRHTPRV